MTFKKLCGWYTTKWEIVTHWLAWATMVHMYTGNLRVTQNLIVNNYQKYDEIYFCKAPKITLYVCIL